MSGSGAYPSRSLTGAGPLLLSLPMSGAGHAMAQDKTPVASKLKAPTCAGYEAAPGLTLAPCLVLSPPRYLPAARVARGRKAFSEDE